MIRLRCRTSRKRACVASTCLLFRSFLSSKASTFINTHGNGQNVETETTMKHYIKTGKVTDAVRLFEESRNGGKSWKIDGCYSWLLHLFVQHNEHEAVDKLYEDIKRNAVFIGEGAKFSMIKSYSNRGLFDQAVGMLHAIVESNIAHHTRHYDYIITSMAKRGQSRKALRVFEEKLERLENFGINENMSAPIKDMIELLLNPKSLPVKENDHGKEGKVDTNHHKKMSNMVFSYLQQTGERLPVKLLVAVRAWLNHDPVYHWKWKYSRISEVGTCSSCGNQLMSGILPGDIQQLERELIKLSNSPQLVISKVAGENLDKKIQKELEELKSFIQRRGPFDVVIDGMNVAAYGSGANMSFSTDRLVATAHHFAAQQKKVLVIVNKAWRTSVYKLEDVCAVFRNKFKNDDLYVLYAAAFSGMQQVEVVTNDRLRDHRLLLPSNVWWTYLRWTRLNCVSFTVNERGKLEFFRQKVDPVVQRSGNSWHFPVEDQSWRCATKSGIKRSQIKN